MGGLAGVPRARAGLHAPALDQPVDPAAYIPVERIRAAVFLSSVGDDPAWPSMRMAREVKKRLERRKRNREVQLWEYPWRVTAFRLPDSPAVCFSAGPGLRMRRRSETCGRD